MIIIDEIQQMPKLFPVLRVLADRSQDNGRFLILGSASPDITSKAFESLAGRIEFVDLHGFNLSETGSEELNRLWIRGGFVRTFLQKDIPQLGINVSSVTPRRFWTCWPTAMVGS
jgi:uncharacterized protein